MELREGKGPAGQHPAAAGSSAPEPAGGGPETLGLLLLAATDAGSLVRSPVLELPGQFSKGALQLAEISERRKRESVCVCVSVYTCVWGQFSKGALWLAEISERKSVCGGGCG